MRIAFSFVLLLSLFSCTAAPVDEQVQSEAIQSTFSVQPYEPMRDPASEADQFEQYFEAYFQGANFYERLVRIQRVLGYLQVSMSDKANARKRLLAQFSEDLGRVILQLRTKPGALNDSYKFWIPTETEAAYKEKIHALAEVVQSAKVMDKLGIYLSASKIFDKDNQNEAFYIRLITQAVGQIEAQFKDVTTLIISIEDKERYFKNAQARYAQNLAITARTNLRKVFSAKQAVTSARIDRVLKQIQNQKNMSEVKAIAKTPEWNYVRQQLKNVDAAAMPDVDGAEDESDRIIATKYGVELINYLSKM